MKVIIEVSDYWYKAVDVFICCPIKKWGCFIVNDPEELTLIDERHAKIIG